MSREAAGPLTDFPKKHGKLGSTKTVCPGVRKTGKRIRTNVRYARASAPEARHGEGLETRPTSARRTQSQRVLGLRPPRDAPRARWHANKFVPGAAIPTPSGVRQAPTMQQQAHMAAAACVHVECIHAAAASAATCKHAALTSLAATHATAHPNGLQAVGGGVAGCALLELPESLPQWKRGDRKREET
eukprot:363426-Chlamydomonas_euryale.AAC.4